MTSNAMGISELNQLVYYENHALYKPHLVNSVHILELIRNSL